MREARPGSANRGDPRLAFPPDNHVVRFRAWVQDCQIFWTRPLIAWSCQTQNRQFQTEENMANSSTKSAKTKVIHAGFLLAANHLDAILDYLLVFIYPRLVL